MMKRKLLFIREWRTRKGQSLIEVALLFPVLLILISGMVEFGFLMNRYLALVDAARNAARFSSDSLYYQRDNDTNCETTRDFYMQTACLVNQELEQEKPGMELDLGRSDDIIISAFTVVDGTPLTVTRHVSSLGWSYSEAITGTRSQSSIFTDQQVVSRLQSGAPSTGLLLVEIYYNYDHLMGLPWITAFVRNPLLLHAYAFMPLVSAEPTPTP